MSVKLFEPIQLRDVEVRNRIFVAPMCQYSSVDGVPSDWHMVHLGTRAVGGAGLVMAEATGVVPEGRISPGCPGMWADKHVDAWRPIVDFIKSQGATASIQIAHAGRKASHAPPWEGSGLLSEDDPGGWKPFGPSDLPFDEDYAIPQELTVDEIHDLTDAFGAAAERSLAAGFEVIELHFAHGYLAHEFLSPISNRREDEYGGSLENRARFALETAEKVREAIPDHLPLLVRISASEYVDGGWDLEQSIQLCKWLKDIGVDMIDASSGGNSPAQKLEPYPGYQVPFAAAIREQVGIATGAVGLITEAHQAEQILIDGEADVVLLARELLRNPYWPLNAAHELGHDIKWPVQYERVKSA
ncbi:MAG: NADH:flavin oxidoreductase/NADH oxidase [Chloroflexi bacterium]|nr:NADH:flavin oxidoreductase/NADH oxidase [Chloroflexota bacterium]